MMENGAGRPVASFDVHAWLETHDEPFVLIDEQFRIVAANRAWCSTFHANPEDFVGEHCFSVVHHNDAPCHQEGEDCPMHRVFNGEMRPSGLHTHYDGEGRPRWVRVTGYKVPAADGTCYFAESLQEIAAADHQGACAHGSLQMVGRSQTYLKMIEKLDRAASALGPVLLLGETGTGKELAASFIHRNSLRSEGPYFCLDCASLPESLFESEVFGHERGSFTGSVGRKKGLFELADGGTLLLDEIGEIPLSMQAKLLRVLETNEFRRVGGETSIKVDVRVVCATNRHLWEGVKEGTFREDLYHRIACFCIRVPPLRERLEDIPLLVEKLLRNMQRTSAHEHLSITPEAIELLGSYTYPGNIRELRNLLEVAAASSGEGVIDAEGIKHVLEIPGPGLRSRKIPDRVAPDLLRDAAPDGNGEIRDGGGESVERLATMCVNAMEDLEKRQIAALLERYDGHREKTAASLGISVRTLYRKLKRYGLS